MLFGRFLSSNSMSIPTFRNGGATRRKMFERVLGRLGQSFALVCLSGVISLRAFNRSDAVPLN